MNVTFNKPVTLIIVISQLLLIENCGHIKSPKITNKDDKTTKVSQFTTAIEPSFEKEITAFVNIIDSIKGSKQLQNVFLVNFDENDSICEFEIRTNYFYRLEHFDGYIAINGYMIAFYNLNGKCSQELINRELLQKEVKDQNFKSEQECIFRPYESQVRKYRIENNKFSCFFAGFE